jgi:peptidoglycan/xylan/chitin deacetylase (PgdA/CDA1 family)
MTFPATASNNSTPSTGSEPRYSRRSWLHSSAAASFGSLSATLWNGHQLRAAEANKALIAITLDLEMSANFPTRDATHWNFEKGNLNDQTKQYSVEAARRVKAAGGVLHFFAVGQVFEHASVDWLKQIVAEGHPVGNHTYDHINVTATDPKDLQFRFQRSPWLLRGDSVADAIRENILLTNKAMRTRLGIDPAGFRTPGGFANGLRDHPEVRAMFRELGFDWISSLYPSHPNTEPMQEPSAAILDDIVAAQARAQPFVYPDGLIEIPMSPISDIGAFRTGRWELEWFLRAIRQSVEWAIEQRAVFDFLAHPSCLYVVDPEFKSIDLICDLVRKAGNRATIVDLETIARRLKATK